MKFRFTVFLFFVVLISCQEVKQGAMPEEVKTQVPSEAVISSVLGKESKVYTTASETALRLTETGKATFKEAAQPLENEVSVFVNPRKSFQTLLGIGGAITDASAEVFAKLPPEKQKTFLTAYYDKVDGIGYSLCRTPIHSSDFSSGSFTYIEEGDKGLETFSIDPDKTYKIPLIKKAIETAGGSLLLYASPWSPPAFMKDNNNMLQGGSYFRNMQDPGRCTTLNLSRPMKRKACRSGGLRFRMNLWLCSGGSPVFIRRKKNVIF